MTPDTIPALAALGASCAFWLLVLVCRQAHRIPPPYDPRGWR